MQSTISTSDLQRLFDLQRQHHLPVGQTTAKERIAKLNRLLDVVMRYRPQMKAAMYADFRKPPFEVDAVEVLPITGAIRHTRRSLRRWMQPMKVPTPLAFIGSSSWVQYEAKGVSLIISPWNFPFNLSLVPLVSAIAAGNTAIIKPSELTPHSSALIKKMVSEVFEEHEVAVVEGGVETSKALMALPFNHIFFTGSASIGKEVMKAAAAHLASVTLELGGKSPAIVDETADLEAAANRIVRAKFANCGQICIAPDYVLVQESVKEPLLKLLKAKLKSFYGEDASKSEHFACVVNDRHFRRITNYLDDAIEHGANIVAGGRTDATQRHIEPTIVTQLPDHSLLMQEEIFGPVLPVRGFEQLQEAIDFVNGRERPLTMSIFSKNKKNLQRVLSETYAGGTCINHAQLHFYNHDLPFGGVGSSGMGNAHGWYGFSEFSNARAVYKQITWGPMELVKAPYDKLQHWLVDFTIKWL